MSMNAPGRKDSFGETLADIWGNKPFAMTLIAAFGLLLYVVLKHGGLTAQAPVDTSSLTPASNPAGMPVGNISNSYTNITSTTTNPVAPAPVPTPAPGQPLPPVPGPGQPTPKPAPGSPTGIPLIPYGQLPAGTRYSTAADLKAQPYLTWNNVQYLKVPGSGGLLWGRRSDGVQIKLYGPVSAYNQ